MENPIKMDDLVVPLFLETPIYFHVHEYSAGLHGVLGWPDTSQGWKKTEISSPTCYTGVFNLESFI